MRGDEEMLGGRGQGGKERWMKRRDEEMEEDDKEMEMFKG